MKPFIFTRGQNVLPSLESILGWQSQFDRVLRWHQRSMQSGNLDDFLAFFLNCYALRDWLINHEKVTKEDIDSEIKSNWAMGVCRDLCNRSKHLILRKNSASIDGHFSIHCEYRGENRPVELVVLADGKKTDLKELTSECVNFWKGSLSAKGLSA